ncbi:hypothetical protein PVAP13_7NG266824 [Panicum virgatum]|uniref:Uncharacterized protein n=1 Tax=Panicum virgatum TaxID=38727 RepID=A0A8T0QAA1_PANVG|nr:hypothetical protein PVAP13_7NG266824 [Panicum virgatum]
MANAPATSRQAPSSLPRSRIRRRRHTPAYRRPREPWPPYPASGEHKRAAGHASPRHPVDGSWCSAAGDCLARQRAASQFRPGQESGRGRRQRRWAWHRGRDGGSRSRSEHDHLRSMAAIEIPPPPATSAIPAGSPARASIYSPVTINTRDSN